ncbi:MAG TPA: serine hydrolase domain-containing protein, partial [Myxococcota bacterium]|nr:serine hydrolase domain-containing protein [Myxococcota bacterium]
MLDQRLVAKAPEDVGIDRKLLEALFERAEKEVREGLLPSAQIAIARNGRIAAMRSFGQVRKGGRAEPATNETLYCVFSSTKAITSAAAWLLIQDGKLDVRRKVAELAASALDAKGAVAVLDEMVSWNPYDTRSLQRKSEVLEGAGDFAGAEAALRDA